MFKSISQCGQKDNLIVGKSLIVKALTQELDTKKLSMMSGMGP